VTRKASIEFPGYDLRNPLVRMAIMDAVDDAMEQGMRDEIEMHASALVAEMWALVPEVV
jgi:hypothetical protein